MLLQTGPEGAIATAAPTDQDPIGQLGQVVAVTVGNGTGRQFREAG